MNFHIYASQILYHLPGLYRYFWIKKCSKIHYLFFKNCISPKRIEFLFRTLTKILYQNKIFHSTHTFCFSKNQIRSIQYGPLIFDGKVVNFDSPNQQLAYSTYSIVQDVWTKKIVWVTGKIYTRHQFSKNEYSIIENI